MTQKKTLTEKQQKFAELLVYNEGKLSPAEAALQAGYTTRARQVSSEMRNPKYFPLVVKYIGELRAEVQEKYGVTLQKHITELAKLRDDAQKKGAWSAAINAEVARGKVGGLYIDQKMILTGSLDNMNEKELEDKMKQILNDYKDIINVTPEEQKSSSSPSETSVDPEDQDLLEEESPSTSH
jgi:phage terminase small subunit